MFHDDSILTHGFFMRHKPKEKSLHFELSVVDLDQKKNRPAVFGMIPGPVCIFML
jgi:hypothetical protein